MGGSMLWRYIAAGAVAAMAVGVLLWVALSPSTGAERAAREARGEQRAAQERVREGWAQVRMASLADGAEPEDARAEDDPSTLTESELASRIEHQSRAVTRTIEPALRDDLRSLTPRQREALIETMATHIALRHQHNGAGHLAFAAQDNAHRWITPDDEHAWERRFKRWYEYTFERSPDTNISVRQIFPRFAEQVHSRFNSRLVGLADEPSGVRARVARGRTSEHAVVELDRATASDDTWFWHAGSSSPAMPLRVPVRSFREVVERSGPATVARVHILARTAGGHTVVLASEWYWDPRAGAWANMSFIRRGLEREHSVGCWF